MTLKTAGEPARLRLTADKAVMRHDGQDLAFITVEVVDRDGNVCSDASIPCEAVVNGGAKLLAFASADLKDMEPTTSPRVETWKGRALLVVRSNTGKGKAIVSVKSELPANKIAIK